MAEYTDARLSGLLSAAIDRSVPDLREEAATAPVSPLTAPDGIVPVQASRRPTALRHTIMGLAACLVLILGLGSYTFFHASAYIGIDVNPSIELTANRFDRVLSVKALNADAEAVLADMDLKYLELDTAVNALVGSMAVHGYFNAGEDVTVTVSVSGGSEAHNRTLQERLAADIRQAAATVGANAQVSDQKPTAPPQPSATPTPSPVVTPPSQTPPPPVAPSPSAVVKPSPRPDTNDEDDDRDDDEDDDDDEKTNNGNHNGWDKDDDRDDDEDDDDEEKGNKGNHNGWDKDDDDDEDDD